MVKEEIHINGLYRHYKEGHYYRVIDVAYWHENHKRIYVIYHKCDENGIFQSIRYVEKEDIKEKVRIIQQPFVRDLQDFTKEVKGIISINGKEYDGVIPRFQFIKEL